MLRPQTSKLWYADGPLPLGIKGNSSVLVCSCADAEEIKGAVLNLLLFHLIGLPRRRLSLPILPTCF